MRKWLSNNNLQDLMLESGLLMSTAAVPTKVGRWCFKNEDSVLMEQLIVPLFDLFQHKGHIPCPYSTSKHVVQWRLKHNLQKFGQCSSGSCDEYCYQARLSNVHTPLATRCRKEWKKHLGAMRTENNNREASEQVQHLLVHKICSTVLTMVYGVSFDHVYRRKATQDKISVKQTVTGKNATCTGDMMSVPVATPCVTDNQSVVATLCVTDNQSVVAPNCSKLNPPIMEPIQSSKDDGKKMGTPKDGGRREKKKEMPRCSAKPSVTGNQTWKCKKCTFHSPNSTYPNCDMCSGTGRKKYTRKREKPKLPNKKTLGVFSGGDAMVGWMSGEEVLVRYDNDSTDYFVQFTDLPDNDAMRMSTTEFRYLYNVDEIVLTPYADVCDKLATREATDVGEAYSLKDERFGYVIRNSDVIAKYLVKNKVKGRKRMSTLARLVLEDRNKAHIKDLFYTDMQERRKSAEVMEQEKRYLVVNVLKEVIPDCRQSVPLVDLSDVQAMGATYAKQVAIERNKRQCYIGPYYDRFPHYTMTESGVRYVKTHFPDNFVKVLSSRENHLFDKRAPHEPVVINNSEVCVDGIPILDTFQEAWEQGYGVMDEVLDCMGSNKKRESHIMNFGVSQVDSNGWTTVKGRRTPGLMSSTKKMSVELRTWLGKMLVLISSKLNRVITDLHPEVKVFPESQERKEVLAELAELLMISEEDVDKLFIGAGSVTLNDYVGPHVDSQNDFRNGFQWLGNSTIVIDTLKLSVTARAKLNKMGYTTRYVQIAFLGYTRWVVGTFADRARKSEEVTHKPFTVLRDLLKKEENEFDYREFIENKSRVLEFLERMAVSENMDFTGHWVSRWACMSRLMYLASFLHMLFLFCLKYEPTNYQMTELIVATAHQTNGQMLWFEVMTDWMRGLFLGKKQFVEQWLMIDDLFIMMSMELGKRNGECTYKENASSKFGSSSHQRYYIGSELIYQGPEDAAKAKALVKNCFDILAGIRNDDVCTALVAEKRFKEVKSEPGFGPVKSLVFLQLAGDTGLINPGFGTWGHTEKGRTGTYNFFNMYEPEQPPNTDLNNKGAKEAMYRTLGYCQQYLDKRITLQEIECGGCEADRDRRKRRKNDIIFWCKTTKQLQNFFDLRRDKANSMEAHLVMYSGDKWHKLTDMFVFIYQQRGATDTTKMIVNGRDNSLPVQKWRTNCSSDPGKMPFQDWGFKI